MPLSLCTKVMQQIWRKLLIATLSIDYKLSIMQAPEKPVSKTGEMKKGDRC